MKHIDYTRAIAQANKHYARLEREYIHKQASGAMLIALQHERNETLERITRYYHKQDRK